MHLPNDANKVILFASVASRSHRRYTPIVRQTYLIFCIYRKGDAASIDTDPNCIIGHAFLHLKCEQMEIDC